MGLFSRFRKSRQSETDVDVEETGSSPSSVPPAVASAESHGEILAELREKLSELSDGQIAVDAIDPGAVLFDFGYVDSLSAVTLIAWIDQRFGVTVTELDLVGALNNLGALAEYVEQGQGG